MPFQPKPAQGATKMSSLGYHRGVLRLETAVLVNPAVCDSLAGFVQTFSMISHTAEGKKKKG